MFIEILRKLREELQKKERMALKNQIDIDGQPRGRMNPKIKKLVSIKSTGAF